MMKREGGAVGGVVVDERKEEKGEGGCLNFDFL
jgi:hypothetical protein